MRTYSTTSTSCKPSWHSWTKTTSTIPSICQSQPWLLISLDKLPLWCKTPVQISPLFHYQSHLVCFKWGTLPAVTQIQQQRPSTTTRPTDLITSCSFHYQPSPQWPPHRSLSVCHSQTSNWWKQLIHSSLQWVISHPFNLPDIDIHLKVTCLYPLTAMTAFNGEEAACLHKCLSAKTFFRFPQDWANNNYDPLHEPSSDEDDSEEEEEEVIWQVQASCCSQHLAQVQGSSHNVCFASATSTSTPASASGISNPPTMSTSATAPMSAVTSGSTPISTAAPPCRASNVPVNPIQPRRTFDLLKLVPSKPWSTDWSPTPGLYTGKITSMEPKIEQAYMLAVEGTSATGLHLSAPSLDALADQFRNLLGNVAESGDFTEVMHPEQSFVLWAVHIEKWV